MGEQSEPEQNVCTELRKYFTEVTRVTKRRHLTYKISFDLLESRRN